MTRRAAGFTLFEVMIAISILGIIVSLIYGAFSSTAESKEDVERGNEIYQEARWALDKMETDLSSAYVAKNANSPSVFYGIDRAGGDNMPADELSFTSFSHVKYTQNTRESDQAEIAYFVMENPETGTLTLYRREDPTPDSDNLAGGEFYELVDDVLAFNLRYYDGYEWTDEWDTRDFSQEENTGESEVENQSDEMINTLPMAVEAQLLVAGPRGTEIAFHTKFRLVLSTIDVGMFDEESDDDETDDDDDQTDGGEKE